MRLNHGKPTFSVNVYPGSFQGSGLNSWDELLGHSTPSCVSCLRSFHFSEPDSQYTKWEAQIALTGVGPKDTHAAMLPHDWRLRQKIIYRCEMTQIELILSKNTRQTLVHFTFVLASASARSLHMKES